MLLLLNHRHNSSCHAQLTSLQLKILTEHLNIFVGMTNEAQTAEIMVEKEENQKKNYL